ncbi:3-deoxy-manno-octulosonate cytidylyltransferase [hydrothermal vent metagenome]|uniref:3-deoxy-manno-octulosonate cytidylyltransferase n=1 Tax=hydrothermal vent metagenome TaxID=652676 RepID=A0A3B0YZW1_9ZZZZ
MNDFSFKVVIPARFDSSRLPGKVLLDIGGKPMLEHVYQRAIECGADEIIVATDNEKVLQVAQDFGANVCMTRSDHRSGTDRIAEVCEQLQWSDDTIVVNLQGDEPLINPVLLSQVAQDLQNHPQVAMSTLCTAITSYTELFDPNVVKVVLDKNHCALYFSRAATPWKRDEFIDIAQLKNSSASIAGDFFRHVGIYCYRASFLNAYSQLQPCAIEEAEALEQLRALWHGYKIYVSVTDEPPGHGVDTQQDLQKVIDVLRLKK